MIVRNRKSLASPLAAFLFLAESAAAVSEAGPASHAPCSVLLARRNWEQHGTDTRILPDGKYTVTAQCLGRSREVRAGVLSPAEAAAICEALGSEAIWKHRSEAPPSAASTRWWGYEITVETAVGRRTARYHTAEANVSPQLVSIVDRIMGVTK